MHIEGLKDLQVIYDGTLHKEMGQHSRLTFTARVPDTKGSLYLQQVGKPIVVKQRLDLYKAGPVIFRGLIEHVDVQQSFHSTIICVCAVSSSILLDQQKKCRIFQDETKKMGDILKDDRLLLNKEMKQGNVRLQVAESLRNIPAEKVIIQNQETNFSFLKRCSRVLQSPLWIQDTVQGLVLKMDCAWHKDVISVKKDEILYWTVGNDLQQRKQLQMTLERYMDVGCTVSFPELLEGKYVIIAVTVQYKDGRDICTYRLSEYKELPKIKKPDFVFEYPLRLYGEVTSVDDSKNLGRIQVRFKQNEPEYEDKDEAQRWIPYRSPYVGKADGIVFLPDVGNLVEVTFLHGTCYAVSAYRNHPLGEEAENVADKFIGNDFKRRIIWKKDSLELLSGKNQIIMDDQKIALIVGKNKMTIDSEKIDLNVGSQSIIRMDASGIHLKSKQSESHITDNVQIQSKGNVIIDNQGALTLQNNKECKVISKGEIHAQGSKEVTIKSSKNLKLQGSKILMS